MTEKLLTFQETTDHQGAALSAIVQSTLEDFGLCKRIGCITMDNASNNDTLMKALSQSLHIPMLAVESRIRCLPHVINLAVKAFLKALGEEEEYANQEHDENSDNLSVSSLLKRLRFIVKKASQ